MYEATRYKRVDFFSSAYSVGMKHKLAIQLVVVKRINARYQGKNKYN